MPNNKQRRATAKRKLERQLERRAKQNRRQRIATIGAVSAVVIALIAAGVWWFVMDKDDDADSASTAATSSVPPLPQDPAATGVLPPFVPPADLGANCQYPNSAEQAAKQVEPPRKGTVPTDPAVISVSVVTNQGPIGLKLNNAQAPCTVNNFVSLTEKGFFNETPCHRLANSPGLSVLQCGDPTGTGSGGPGYQFANEYPTNQYAAGDPASGQPIVYPRGTLAMANAGPGTNGSQFFLVYKDSQLPPLYTVFGTVDEKDLPTLDKMVAAGVAGGGEDGKPAADVIITSVRLD